MACRDRSLRHACAALCLAVAYASWSAPTHALDHDPGEPEHACLQCLLSSALDGSVEAAAGSSDLLRPPGLEPPGPRPRVAGPRPRAPLARGPPASA